MSIYDISGNPLGISAEMPFINVKEYGAKGDGVTDDAQTIQNALDVLSQTGGIIFFPVGTYLIKSGLLFYNNQTLYFENGAVLLQGAGIDNLIMSYCADGTTEYNGTHDVLIYGAIFDGGAYTINNTLVGIVHCKNITFENCIFKNAYGTWHNLEINSSYNVKVINCDFEGTRKTGQNGCMIQVDSIDNTSTWPWTNRGEVDSTISKHVEIIGTVFHNNTVSPAVGNHSQTAIQHIRIHDCVFDGLTSNRGAIAFQSGLYVYAYDNVFDECTTALGTNTKGYNNVIDGILTSSTS